MSSSSSPLTQQGSLKIAATLLASFALANCSSTSPTEAAAVAAPAAVTPAAVALETAVAGTNQIADYNAPKTLAVGQKVTFQVSYSTTSENDIMVMLQNTAKNYEGAGYARTTVKPGAGLASITVPVFATAAAGDAYQWQILLTTKGGNWNEKIHNKAVGGVSLK